MMAILAVDELIVSGPKSEPTLNAVGDQDKGVSRVRRQYCFPTKGHRFMDLPSRQINE